MNLFMSFLLLFLLYTDKLAALNFNTDVTVTWGQGHVVKSRNGEEMELKMDQYSGASAQTNAEFLFGRFDMHVKLNSPDSRGTITTFYLQSPNRDLGWDEADFEFIGGSSIADYKIHTNLITNGIGNREQQFRFPFDPTTNYHTYSFFWTPQQILWYVDGIPIRVYRKLNDSRILYPDKQPMKVYTSLWNNTDWIGEVNWKNAPFSAHYRSFYVNACVAWRDGSNVNSYCKLAPPFWFYIKLLPWERDMIIRMREQYMTYDYCTDKEKVTNVTSIECANNP
ncbi:hypothetical protein LUZ61_013931 [Rhynchospora tenuis]|uniref:GH16 domain-containing protein n=1 Tax=Rhynchospora tenuis TaxID=198213 RepID=A0AAD5WA52_9POAL|nr:hypothetical protein LUZ61_013931 [Rhynchospora tenuis]